MMLHAAQANLEANSEAAIRQATSASKAAEELMSQKDKSATDVNVEEAEKKISQLKEELSEARKGKILYTIIHTLRKCL
jgi:flagellin-specific chaperone FliS